MKEKRKKKEAKRMKLNGGRGGFWVMGWRWKRKMRKRMQRNENSTPPSVPPVLFCRRTSRRQALLWPLGKRWWMRGRTEGKKRMTMKKKKRRRRKRRRRRMEWNVSAPFSSLF